MGFRINSLYLSDGYKVGHKSMLAPGTTRLYGTWIPRSLKHAPKGINKIVTFYYQAVWKRLNDEFNENFFFTAERNLAILDGDQDKFEELKANAMVFAKDMSDYLGMEYDGSHFEKLWDIGYLPIRVKALPEGIETLPNIPHMTFINTVKGFGWLTLYLETIVSNQAWKGSTSATIAKLYRRRAEEWVNKTDKSNIGLVDWMCHDFSSRGLSGVDDMIAVGLGHATSFRGSDTLVTIPAARYYYNETEVCIGSVNASEHSVSTTKIFTVGEKQMIIDWLKEIPNGIFSMVCDTFSTWQFIEYLKDPEIKELVLNRNGKLVVRPDSGDPADIICGKKPKKRKYFAEYSENDIEEWLEISSDEMITNILNDKEYIYELDDFLPSMSSGRDYTPEFKDGQTCYIKIGNRVIAFEVYIGECLEATWSHTINETDIKNLREVDPIEKNSPEAKGVVELLWDIFGGTVNEQGYKVLDPHIGAIYGDSITLEIQVDIYERLAEKGFASTNIVLGIGSFTYEYMTRDTLGFAAKGAWFEVEGEGKCNCGHTIECDYVKQYDIYKDPITDDGTKKSLKGFLQVYKDEQGEYRVKEQCTVEEENTGELQLIFENGKFYNETSLTEIRKKLNEY